MPDFIFQANIAHYKELLATETDARKIATLHKLLSGRGSQAGRMARQESQIERGKIGLRIEPEATCLGSRATGGLCKKI